MNLEATNAEIGKLVTVVALSTLIKWFPHFAGASSRRSPSALTSVPPSGPSATVCSWLEAVKGKTSCYFLLANTLFVIKWLLERGASSLSDGGALRSLRLQITRRSRC